MNTEKKKWWMPRWLHNYLYKEAIALRKEDRDIHKILNSMPNADYTTKYLALYEAGFVHNQIRKYI